MWGWISDLMAWGSVMWGWIPDLDRPAFGLAGVDSGFDRPSPARATTPLPKSYLPPPLPRDAEGE